MNDGLVGLAIENQGDVIIARLTGELDIAGAPSTGEQIGQAVPNSALGLVVDMSELEFIDSSGVAMLFGLVRRLSSRRQELRVVAPQGRPVARVLEIVEFDRAAPISRDRRGSGRDLLSGERHLGWDGVHNARDLGGLSIAGGGETRWGAVIRADSLGKLTPAGWAALQAYGVRTVIDLRNDDEVERGARRDPGHADDPPSARRDRPLGRLRGVAGRHPSTTPATWSASRSAAHA